MLLSAWAFFQWAASHSRPWMAVAALMGTMLSSNWTGAHGVIVLCEIIGWRIKDRRDRNLDALLASPPLNLEPGQRLSTDKLFLPLYAYLLIMVATIETAIAVNMMTYGDVVVPVFVLVLALANMGFEFTHIIVAIYAREAELLSVLLGMSLEEVPASSKHSNFCMARWEFRVTE